MIKKPGLLSTFTSFLIGPPKEPHHQHKRSLFIWDKFTFNKWYEENVQGHFCVGDLITLKDIPPVPNTIPFHYKITFLHEMWYNVKFNSSNTEPVCLCCTSLGGGTINKAPSEMRKLTVEEVALVNLSNIKAQGTA
jgi:hypothetical protein